ncbi:MAG: ABC-type transport auxiliary lipoprotein family protein [Novosphingobium sp.]
MKGGIVMRIMGKGVPLLAAALLAGCVSVGVGGGGKGPTQLITLTAESTAPAGNIGSGSLADALVVLDPDTDRRLDVQRVPVQVDDSTLAYLQNAAWVERPARQFRRLLAETIRARGNRLVLESSDDETGGRITLSGRLLEMGYDARASSVIVRFDAVRKHPNGQLEARRFESVVPGIAPKAAEVSPALNRAANDVARQVSDWVTGAAPAS